MPKKTKTKKKPRKKSTMQKFHTVRKYYEKGTLAILLPLDSIKIIGNLLFKK